MTEGGELVSLIERGTIPPEQVARAVDVAALSPSSRAWAVLIDRLLLWLGGLALAFAVLFFIAYNWAEMGRWPRFALVQVALVLAAGVAVWGSTRRLIFKVAITAASLLVGVLLALVGQVYQTGADPWQLFFAWAVFTLPWVWVARFDVLWVLWLGLLNVALWLYVDTWGGALDGWFIQSDAIFWWLFALNTTALAVWEWGLKRRGWCSSRWGVRLLALGSGVPVTFLMMTWIVNSASFTPTLVVYPLWLAALYGVYRRLCPDLLLVAGGCVSVISVVTLLLARFLIGKDEWQADSMLMLALVVLVMGAGAVVWLKRLHREATQ
ncbi:DUF2157 domain-containing protein [Halomonas sp. SH5A2]|nr:DUF2157 domain-containing protein [Halomonas sp. SH5A2]